MVDTKVCLTMSAAVFLYANDVKIYQFKAKDSDINAYLLCLGNISKTFTVDIMKNITVLNGYMVVLQIFMDILSKT